MGRAVEDTKRRCYKASLTNRNQDKDVNLRERSGKGLGFATSWTAQQTKGGRKKDRT